MGDLYVHVRIKECCRKTLRELDAIKKGIRGAGAYKVELLKALGEKTIPDAMTLLATTIGKSAPEGDQRLVVVKKKTLVKVATTHEKMHRRKGETREALFWQALAALFDGSEAPRGAAADAEGIAGTPAAHTKAPATHTKAPATHTKVPPAPTTAPAAPTTAPAAPTTAAGAGTGGVATGAQEESFRAEGRGVIAGGSFNPPDPIAGCDKAKQDARNKATAAGFSGRVEWDRLSNDSDCSLKVEQAGSVGWFYIFTARGTFYK